MVLISDGHGGDEGPRLRDPALGLSAFRSRLYGCFGRRADALFELTLWGIAPTRERFAVQQVHWFRVAEGKVAEHWAVRDDLGMMRQLGITPK